MIDGKTFTETVENYFSFLIDEFGYNIIDRKIMGNAFYELQYRDNNKRISISYENAEDYLLVIVFLLPKGEVPDYDDKTKTLHLEALTPLIFPRLSMEEITDNNDRLSIFIPGSIIERKLLKCARDLRLCLKHFDILV